VRNHNNNLIIMQLSGKNWQKDNNGKGMMGCGSGMGLSWELVGV